MGRTGGITATAVLGASALIVTACSAPPEIMDPATAQFAGGSSLLLDASKIPDPALVPLLEQAGQTCTGVDAPTLAAQIETESGWNPAAVSPAGAQGIAQFMAGTWATFGGDYNADGVADPFDPADAIGSQAALMCDTYAQVTQAIDTGTISGDPMALTLAAYNAGYSAVLDASGIPDFSETQKYVAAIMDRRTAFAVAGAGGPPVDGYFEAGPNCPDQSDPKEAGLQASTVYGLRCVRQTFTSSSISSGWRARGSVSTSDHPAGLAIDVTPSTASWESAEGNRIGWQIAHWFQINANRLGVKYIIWDNYRWPAYDGRRGWVAYDHSTGRTDPSANHRDHVHVSFNSAPGDPNAALIGHDPQLEQHRRGQFLSPEQALPPKENP